jgi:hypothetical protein
MLVDEAEQVREAEDAGPDLAILKGVNAKQLADALLVLLREGVNKGHQDKGQAHYSVSMGS